MTIRAAFYIDGFNVYHAIDDLNKPHYKWLNWLELAQTLIPSQSETLERVVICTALRTDDAQKMIRHRAYIAALEAAGVEVIKGSFLREPRRCHSCQAVWQAPVEKQGDVNIALEAVADAYEDRFDHCYIVSADSDQAATARVLKARFPEKKLTTVTVSPRSHSKEIFAIADAKIKITEGHLSAALFGKLVQSKDRLLKRPAEYDPPEG